MAYVALVGAILYSSCLASYVVEFSETPPPIFLLLAFFCGGISPSLAVDNVDCRLKCVCYSDPLDLLENDTCFLIISSRALICLSAEHCIQGNFWLSVICDLDS